MHRKEHQYQPTIWLFREGNVAIEVFGNVYAATSFLYGLAVEDVDPSLLAVQDDTYPLVVCARACRAA